MREILFRGKRKDNGEWVYGFYCNCIRAFNGEKRYHAIQQTDDNSFYFREIIPETIGQFTGLTDKKGKKIFEGDIVKEWSSHWKTPLKTEINIYEVVCENLGSLHLIRKTEYGETSTLLYRRSIVEIVGNIHDNPELLEANE